MILEFEEGQSKNVNVFQANREILEICGSQPKIRPQGNGSLLIETSSPEQSQKLKQMTTLDGIAIKCFSHPIFNQCRGVVYAPELIHIEEEVIEKELKSQGIIKVKRMQRKIGEQLVPLGTLILTFNQCRLPNFISAGWLSLKVKPYIPSPLRCYHCQMFGHLSQKCRDKINEKPATCSNCGKESHGSCNAIPSCINCGEQHPSSSKSCVKFIFEKEVQAIRALEKIPFKDARRKALEKQIRPGELFSTVLRRINPNSENRNSPNRPEIPVPSKSNDQRNTDSTEKLPEKLLEENKEHVKATPIIASSEKASTSAENPRSDTNEWSTVGRKRERTPEQKAEELFRQPNFVASKNLMLSSRNTPRIKRLNSEK